MRIRWNNIIGLLLAALLIYLLIHASPMLDKFFEDMTHRQLWPEDPVWQFNLIGLLCLTAVALAKVLRR